MNFSSPSLVPCFRILPGVLLILATGCTHPGTPSRPANRAVAAAEGAFDDDAHKPTSIESSVIAAGKDPAKLAALERELLATMQKPGASPALVQEAAQHLGYVMQAGASGPDTVTLAVLAPMLTDPARVDYARLALDRVPGERVDAVYLAALPATSGRVRLALIETVATRALTGAVPLLAPGLNESDPVIAAASARALGRIGGKAALAALDSAKDPLAPDVLNARLAAAAKIDATTAARTAGSIYRNPAAPLPQRSAALRHLIDASPMGAVAEIHAALIGSEPAFHAVAIHAVSTLPVPGSAAELTGGLASYPPAVQVALVAALGARGDAGAVPGLLKALEGTDADVRLATLDALGRLPGNTDVARQLALRADGSGAEAKAAFTSLARLNGPGLDDFIRTGAASGDAALQSVFIQQIAARNLTEAIPFLLGLRSSTSEPLRLEALDALRGIAPPSDQQALINWAIGTTSKAEQVRATRAIVAMILRDDAIPVRTDPVLAAIAAGDANAQLILLPVLSRVPGTKTLAAAGSLALSNNETLAPAAAAELSRWPDAAALPLLVETATKTQVSAARSAAVSGATRFLSQSSGVNPGERSSYARILLGLPAETSTRLPLINVLSLCADQPALDAATGYLSDPATVDAARDAVDAIHSNLAGPPAFTASHAPANTAFMSDGKTNTHWMAPNAPGSWLRADLHNSRPVRKLILDQGTREWDYPATLEIQVSEDPDQPGAVLTQSGGTRFQTVVSMPSGIRGRYVWIRETGTRGNSWAIAELAVE